jgi:phenylpropionate dioxygenase-like ring-hydroxylating dioxygenase large terminal subunit
MEGTKTLPASWYCSKNLYELERRAVFLKSWYLLGPVVRFAEEKEVDFEIAGITINVQSTGTGVKENFQVTDKAHGTNLPFHLTKTGLLFAAPSQDAPSFQSYFPDLEELTDKYDFRHLPHRRSIRYEGKFNWKTMVDGYQECLHCQYTHRSFSVLYPPTFYEVHNHANYSRHIADPAKFEDGLFLYFFPICTLNLSPEPGVTRMEFDYYHEKEGEEFETYFKFVRKVAMEDYELCEVAQGNLERGVYSQGVLNQVKEGGVLREYSMLLMSANIRYFGILLTRC